MLLSLVVAAAVAFPGHVPMAGLLAGAVVAPRFTVLIVGVLVVLGSRGSDPSVSEPLFLHALAAEMRAGAGLRTAIQRAAERVPGLSLESAVRLARSGHPMSDVGQHVSAALDRHGRLVGASLDLAATTGGRVAETFDLLAYLAAGDAEQERDTRAAMVPARFGVLVIGGGPLIALALMAVSGRIGLVADTGPTGVGLAVLGVGLILTGVGVTVLLARRAMQ